MALHGYLISDHDHLWHDILTSDIKKKFFFQGITAAHEKDNVGQPETVDSQTGIIPMMGSVSSHMTAKEYNFTFSPVQPGMLRLIHKKMTRFHL